jgi:hypothetical protein
VTYLDEIADAIRNAVPTDALPNEDTAGLFLSYAILLLAKWEAVTREDVHNAWVGWMVSKGEGDESHESMVPFSELPPETQAEDSPFVIAIRTVARKLKAET